MLVSHLFIYLILDIYCWKPQNILTHVNQRKVANLVLYQPFSFTSLKSLSLRKLLDQSAFAYLILLGPSGSRSIFGCERSPISRNVRSLVSQSVSACVRQMQNNAK